MPSGGAGGCIPQPLLRYPPQRSAHRLGVRGPLGHAWLHGGCMTTAAGGFALGENLAKLQRGLRLLVPAGPVCPTGDGVLRREILQQAA
jgi:hypothetical protein